jgi:hypothetical protein
MNIGNQIPGVLQRSNDESTRFKYLRISSNEISSGGTPYNFTVNFGNDGTLDRCIMIKPICCVCPNIANNISVALKNNTFLISCTGTVITYTSPDGFYSVSVLLANLVAYINSVKGAGYCTGTIVNNHVVLTVTGSDILGISAVNNPMAYALGYTDSGFNASITASSLPSLSGATILYIHNSTVGNNNTYLNTNNNNVSSVNGIFTLPMTGGFGVVESQLFDDSQKLVLGSNGMSIRQLNFTLRVNGGRLYDELTVNQEFILVLKIYMN